MKTEKISEQFVQNLLLVMPDWHSKLIKPFKDTLNREMSLETYYCLETVKRCGAITMTKLAQELKVPKQQVTKLTDKLSEYQFVERVSNDQDRRSVWIRLTPKASAYLDEYYLKNKVFIHMLEELLTEEELQRLNNAVQVLIEILPKLK
ncbi:MarR family winged helix-turn-helix transcriptional regulator [Murimonas intestini]|uniref:DNA-binding MarR family transcriptional regulator n=1 Tax=Murimonas intestini TaxID=1337051 RepID=A0AB73T9U0_9FIRM|nr:MarR family transcriptional regulator [Murimonas intestini]MCR1839305.1 MarR family transcriptional regulator [Murimonas intestini]MCR1864600.1 MarR family transcriptional regulator [Murimonas intestini]MCR1882210.1 MarR family transcriptional regulator [Murimonas intestini]